MIPSVEYRPDRSIGEYLNERTAADHAELLAAYGFTVTRRYEVRDEPFVGPTTYHIVEVHHAGRA